MRRSVETGRKIANAVDNMLKAVGSTLSDPRTPEEMMRDDNVAVLKEFLHIRYKASPYLCGKVAGWMVKQLYQPSMKLEPHQWLWLIENKVRYPERIQGLYSYTRQAKARMYTGVTYSDGTPVPPLVNEWISEARKQ